MESQNVQNQVLHLKNQVWSLSLVALPRKPNKDLSVLGTCMCWLCMACLLSFIHCHYEHWAKEDTKCHQLQSAVMGSRGFCALKFYINSKSLTLNLKKYMLSLIPNSTSFYNLVFDIQCHLRPQVAYIIGIGCLHLSKPGVAFYFNCVVFHSLKTWKRSLFFSVSCDNLHSFTVHNFRIVSEKPQVCYYTKIEN